MAVDLIDQKHALALDRVIHSGARPPLSYNRRPLIAPELNHCRPLDHRAIRFPPASELTERRRLSADSPTAFNHSTAGPRPAAFVLANRDLESLVTSASVGPELDDRGRKHPAKGLKALLLGRGSTPAIRGSYRHPGQLARSVRTFLHHAVEAGEDKIYLVGADEELIETLWARARPPSGRRPGGGQASETGTPASEGSDPDPFEVLLDLLEPIDVPPELESRFVGHSRRAQLVRQLILRAARTSDPVLILGASGTGKEVVARSVHDFGERRAEPFITVNCAAIPADLLESELFGHERGAFTGANYKKPGLWKVAGRGTLFLDEVADLHGGHQAKLLRALQEGVVRPIGADREIRVRARILAATNRDLYSMVRRGEFREDLYFRLRSFLIETPNLQDNPEDIPTLTTWFWRQVTDRKTAKLPARLSDVLADRAWPGNARELRSVLSNLHALFGPDELDIGHLGAVLRLHGYDLGSGPPPRVRARMSRLTLRDALLRLEDATRAARSVLAPLSKRRLELDQLDRIRSALDHRLEEMRSVTAAVLEDGVKLGTDCERNLRRVRRGLVDLAAELEIDVAAARHRFRRELRPAFEELTGCLQHRLDAMDQV